MSARSTKERPVDIAFSGPSGGAVGAAYLARRAGVPNVLTFDMGGTSTDVALCRDGEVAIKREAQLGYYQFQARGADIHSVGAGGGSIAYLNLAGALKVGPAQRGRRSRARPATAAAATEPTVTDANVVLGRLPGGSKLGGRLALDVDAARAGGRRRSPRGWASTRSPRRRRSSTSPTRTCTRRCASCQRRARLRPARLRSRRLRRRRAAARQRAGAAHRRRPADRPDHARAC